MTRRKYYEFFLLSWALLATIYTFQWPVVFGVAAIALILHLVLP